MDKPISELIEALSVLDEDLYVLEQGGEPKKLKWATFIKFAAARLDGHGGIQSIALTGTSGLVDTYTITMSDEKTYDIVVKNGRGISEIYITGTEGLVDTYTISYNNGTSSTFTVKNGAKGDKGDNTYTWIKYASQEPTEASHSMGDIPDDWRGEYNGPLAEAPTDWKQYKWYKMKGEKGDTGDPATVASQSVTYQVSDSGTIIPSGSWVSSIPVVPQGKYLWTKTELQFNTGDPIVSYSVARMGIDGSGAVSSVAGVSPDPTGNVTLTAADVSALSVSGGDVTGEIRMNGQPISGLNDPTEDTHAARKSYVDKMLPKTGGAMTGAINMGTNRITDLGTPVANADAATKGYVDTSVAKAAPRNLLDNSDFRNPVNQRGQTSYTEHWGHTIDRWYLSSGDSSGSIKATVTLTDGGLKFTPSSEAADRSALVQRLPQNALRAGVDYTFVAKKSDGDYLFGGIEDNTASNGFWQAALFIDTEVTLEWAALYEGEYTAETLPEYHPKGYGAELAECMRYYRWLKIGGAVNGNYIGYRIPLSPAMRTNPSTTGININTTSGPATITAGGYSAESDCFRVDAYIGSDADKWWALDVALDADL